MKKPALWRLPFITTPVVVLVLGVIVNSGLAGAFLGAFVGSMHPILNLYTFFGGLIIGFLPIRNYFYWLIISIIAVTLLESLLVYPKISENRTLLGLTVAYDFADYVRAFATIWLAHVSSAILLALYRPLKISV